MSKHTFACRVTAGIAVSLVLVLAGCNSQPPGNGNGGSEPGAGEPTPGANGSNTGGSSALSPVSADFVISPKQDSDVPASRVTVFGKMPAGAVNVFVTGASAWVQEDRTYYVPNIPLTIGHNSLIVEAVDGHGKPVVAGTLAVNRTTDTDPVRIRLPSEVVPIGVPVEAVVESPLTISSVMVDFDGDGKADVDGTAMKVSHTYTKSARYPVSATVKTSDGLYFTSELGPVFNPVNRVVVGLANATVGTIAIPDATDIETGPGQTVWVLTARELVHVTTDLVITKRLALPADFSGAGFGIAVDGGFVIADAAGNRLLKLNVAGVADAQFGIAGFVSDLGSEHGRLAGPVDAAVDEDGNVHVLDAGNARIVTLGPSGQYIKEVGVGPGGKRLVQYAGMLYLVGGTRGLGTFTKQLLSVDGVNLSLDGITSAYPSRDGYQFAFGTSEGKVYLTDSVGRVLATLSTGASSVLNAVTIQEDKGPAIIVATSSGEVHKIAIPQDSSETSPTGVWQAFVERLSAADVDGALAHIEPRARSAARKAFEHIGSADIATVGRRYGPLSLVERDDSYAFYSAQIDSGPPVRSIGFVRDPRTLSWFISKF